MGDQRFRYYVAARPGAVRQQSHVHLRDCRYLIGPVTEVQNLRGKNVEEIRAMPNACGVCIGSKRFERMGAGYERQKTVKD